MRTVFWVNIPSIHLVPFLKALASIPQNSVTMVCSSSISENRKGMGWSLQDLGDVELIVSPDDSLVEEIICHSGRDTYHVFGGFSRDLMISKAFKHAIRKKTNIGIMSEPYNWLGMGGTLRYLRSIYQRVKYGKNIRFILAIGNKAVDVFLKAGFPQKKIFEFSYVTFSPIYEDVTLNFDTPFKIMFAGSLINRKGVDFLLTALSELKSERLEISIIGEGPEKEKLHKMVTEHKLEFVRFYPFVENKQIGRFMGQHDLLVLPSRRDGWGAVINEALMQGTPVICSNNCGASVLLSERNRSSVFQSGSPPQLAKLIKEQISKGKVGAEERREIRNWSFCINGVSVATYYMDIIGYIKGANARPIPPWRFPKSRDVDNYI